MSDSRALADAKSKAVNAFTLRSTILIVAAGDLSRMGTGILMQTEGGRPFLLTARHLIEDDGPWKPLRLMIPGLNGLEVLDAGLEAEFAPSRPASFSDRIVDVALVTLKPELHDLLRPIAAGLESIATDDAVGQTDVAYLVGFPSFMGFRDQRDPRIHQMSMITYATGVKGTDKHGRLEVDWRDAVPGPEVASFPHLNFRAGEATELGHPSGISGGGLWRFKGAGKGELWSPTSDARLIGIPVAFNELFTEYAETVLHWGNWVREQAARIDR